MDKIKFEKKNISVSFGIDEIKKDIDMLLDKNEEAIRKYISRYIYTSSISLETNKQIDELFKQVRDNLI